MRRRTKLALWLGAGGAFLYMTPRRRHWPGFRGRVVMITGGTRGLGLVMAREFASRGARLAVCARAPGKVEAARWELSLLGAAAPGPRRAGAHEGQA